MMRSGVSFRDLVFNIDCPDSRGSDFVAEQEFGRKILRRSPQWFSTDGSVHRWFIAVPLALEAVAASICCGLKLAAAMACGFRSSIDLSQVLLEGILCQRSCSLKGSELLDINWWYIVVL